MVENLAVESTKCKPFRLSRSDRRLVGWVKFRLEKSSKPFVHLCLKTFCKATGIGLRTAKRSVEKIRTNPSCEIIVRTIHEDRRWKILVSSSARLHGLKRSEPFLSRPDGTKRIVKKKIRGEEIKEEQLVLNDDPVMWKAEPNQGTANPLPEEQETHNPLQTEIMFPVATQPPTFSKNNQHFNECQKWVGLNKRVSPEEKQRFKHGKADFGVKTRNLAFWMARNDLRNEWWDNCKVSHSLAHTFNYALQALQAGCNRKTITKAYRMALEDVHGMAVDRGVTDPSSWPPSSTINRARIILADNGCHGKWNERIAKQSEKIIISAHSKS